MKHAYEDCSLLLHLLNDDLSSYPHENWQNVREFDDTLAVIIEGVELDLHMRGFEFFNLVSSYAFDSLSLIHLKATRRIKFQGKVVKPVISISDEQQTNTNGEKTEVSKILAGDVSITAICKQYVMVSVS
uniref:Uncharacterized protein n=1 Tax=Lactuca sativa TaxID=4236 RepID=A0A9R1UIM6_LACSA|nr:hypothetical protein LSAT_V11C900490050 [Lactuca sativa]